MEAPKKVYIDDFGSGFSHGWHTEHSYERDIEYVRKDAFIKKACDFFEENIEEEDCKIGSSEWTELRAEYKSLDSFIRAFVEYMKGE